MSVSIPVSHSSQNGFTGFSLGIGGKKALCEMESAANKTTHMFTGNAKEKTTLWYVNFGTYNV